MLVLSGFLGIFFSKLKSIHSAPITSWAETHAADCGIVLTGGAGRVREGFALLSRQQIKKLVITGVHPDTELEDLMPFWPVMNNFSDRDVVLERISRTTYGNAQQSLAIAEALSCRDVILITSASHMLRSYQTFRRSFPAAMAIYQHAIPNSRSENDWTEMCGESLKSLFYQWVLQPFMS